MKNREHRNQKAWVGIVLVILGAFFLLRNLDMIPYFIPYYFFGWEMILILIGGAMLVTGRKEGFLFLGIGGFFLLPEVFEFLNLPRFRIRDWWPVVLIIIGISIVLRRRDSRDKRNGEIDDDYLDDTSIFGGSEKSFTSQNFKGGKVTAIFGGSQIDFSAAKLSEEQDVVLDVFVMFGGNEFRIPNDWTVINDSFVIFGGFSDNRPQSAVSQSDPKKVLRIKGFVMFGGAEVKGA